MCPTQKNKHTDNATRDISSIGHIYGLRAGDTAQQRSKFFFKQNNDQQECTHREQTSADPEDPDFGLWTPGSEA